MTWKNDKRYAVALTHDVDYPEIIRWVECLRNPRRSIFPYGLGITNIIPPKDTFWRFNHWMDFEDRYNMKSAFYFCAKQGSLLKYLLGNPDPFYNVKQEKYFHTLCDIERRGFEIGMHASYNAYLSQEQFAEEKYIVELATKDKIKGNRHHYWHYDLDNPQATFKMQARIGLAYDTSVNYALCGCQPFFIVPGLIELPVTLNDSQLFKYNRGRMAVKKFNDYKPDIDRIVEYVRSQRGLLMVDYHVRVLSSIYFPHWGDSYKYLLDKITEKDDYWNATPQEIAGWVRRKNEANR